MPRKRKEEVPVEPGKGLNLGPELIKQLVPGTLDRASINEQFAALKKAIFERALGGELTHHLGYEKGEAKPVGRTNHRNGTSRKRIATDNDLLDVEIPRDREGTFDPVLIAKGERRFTGFDDKIIAMYARGMSVREIQGFLLEMYGIDVSPDFISTVTDAVIDEVREWQQRPLEPMYPVVFFDALRVKIRDEGVVRNKAIYLALGVRRDGTRDVLGLWIEQTEGAKFWLRVVNDLKLRGVQDILIAVVDGLKGFPEAINTVFPETTVQTCIVHLIRNSLDFASWKDRKSVAAALKEVYRAPSAEAAAVALDAFDTSPWGTKYPPIAALWRRAWDQVIPFYAFAPDIRKIVYTTNAIESLHMQLRKIIKARGHFPSDEAALKLIWLALRNVVAKWTGSRHDWKSAMTQFALLYPERFNIGV
ncbi:IS256 family transposase (plasmid) [Burkholderia multivorans]|uniref:IS256 family transposase n=1 Tax=Burkholderia multivorans TaxID=87883 RepID=UPI00201A17BA|nr:IS256 family transposase [Burkholderia multivorans]MCO1362912.1 IS256 family transposase [Burkholderia multivorans]MCO1422797.1 IS256 family transposase [Burkholderia multivorans]UQO98826.1 IS256 family transposase [Burkholderia multivorans]